MVTCTESQTGPVGRAKTRLAPIHPPRARGGPVNTPKTFTAGLARAPLDPHPEIARP